VVRPLDSLVASCLPEGATLAEVRREGSGWVALFQDAEGEHLAVEWWMRASSRPFYRQGQRLAFAYRKGSERAVATSQGVIAAMLAREEALVSLSSVLGESRPGGRRSGRISFLRETHLSRSIARALPGAGGIRRAARLVIEEELARGEPVSDVQIYFENPCAQACEFCEEPLLRDRPYHRLASGLLRLQSRTKLDLVSTGAFDEILNALWSRPDSILLTVTGHDWLRHPHRDALLEALERPREGARLRVQGPSTELADPALARRVAALPGLERIATTLEAGDPAVHDALVGAPGAHARLVRALELLHEVPVELALVLTRRAVRVLPATLRWLRERRWRVVATMFIPDRSMPGAEERLVPLDELREALLQEEKSWEAIQDCVGVPPCAVPPGLRGKIRLAVRAAERDSMVFAPECSRCLLKEGCPGLPSRYLRAFGARGIEPCTSTAEG
jgi:hypothetical protein